MKKNQMILFLVLFPILVGGCAWFQVQEGQETWEHRLGRVSAKIVLSNNPDYIPETEQAIGEGLALVTGESVDPAAVMQGIVDFANKLLKGQYEEYRDIVTEVLDFLKGLVEFNLDIPEEKQKAAQKIEQFLLGANEGLQNVKESM